MTRNADECLFHWAAVQKAAESEWEKKFTADVAERARKPWWRPSAKQLEIMDRMVSDLFPGIKHDLIESD